MYTKEQLFALIKEKFEKDNYEVIRVLDTAFKELPEEAQADCIQKYYEFLLKDLPNAYVKFLEMAAKTLYGLQKKEACAEFCRMILNIEPDNSAIKAMLLLIVGPDNMKNLGKNTDWINVRSQINGLYREHKYEEALKLCNEYLYKHGDVVEILKLKADILIELKRKEECAEVYLKILQVEPGNARAVLGYRKLTGKLPPKDGKPEDKGKVILEELACILGGLALFLIMWLLVLK